MDGDRGLSLIAHPDQWARCRHTNTALLDGGGVELTWFEPIEPTGPGNAAPGEPDPCEPVVAGGLAFDRWCRAYRSLPSAGRVEVLSNDAVQSPRQEPGTVHPGTLKLPRGLAVDGVHRLYVAEAGAGTVRVVDLWSQRLRRRVSVRSRQHPRRRSVDLAATCCGAVVLLHRPVSLVVMKGRRGPLPGPRVVPPPQAGGLRPSRIAARGEQLFLLWSGTDPSVPAHGRAAVVAHPDGTVVATADGGTDLDVTPDGVLVIARASGQAFLRFRDTGGGWSEIEPLGAGSYDGGAVAVAPDGRVAFTTRTGFTWTSGPQVTYADTAEVVSYRLDAGTYRTRWGRVFLDACIPPGTRVVMRFLTSDDDDVSDPLPASPPARGGRQVPHPDLTPPLPSEVALRELTERSVLHRRATGREWPWAQIAADDAFETYETPVTAQPGRYLWVVLELSGTRRTTPRVRAVRIERPGHRLLHQLPRAWSRQDDDARFLHRFLAPAEGILHELDERAAQRDLLLDPRATPQEALGWLAGLVGLVLDRRWPEAARRALVAEAFQLFRIRGTRACLERLLGLYLGREVQVMENWRLRGLGGVVLGTTPAGPPAPAVGGAARTSGALGRFILGEARPGQEDFTATAHRFTVLVPGDLTTEQRDAVQAILDHHKPAHTLAEICELGSGLRVGREAHVRLTAYVGPPTGWGPVVVGQVLLGGDGVVGVPSVAGRIGDTAVGRVRLG